MNSRTRSSSRPAIFSPRALVLACTVAAMARLGAAEAGNEKPFVLFMGADIDVEQGKEAHRVKNVAGDSFVITVDNRPVEVPMNRGRISMKVTPQLKLTDKTAVVNELKIERAYTPDNDPNRKFAASQSGGAAQAAVGNSVAQMNSAQQGLAAATARAGAMGGPGFGVIGDNNVGVATNNFQQAVHDAGSDQNNAGIAAMKLQEELDKKLFDAIRVNCVVSAPHPMSDPYLVVVAQYREKDDPPGTTKSWIFAKALDRLGEQPLTVRFLQGGFPEGFELLKQQLHLYGSGRELGTNVAAKNVPLTRDEAHEYIVIDHLTTHKGATLEPSLALGVRQAEIVPHFVSTQLQQEIFVKVDKGGLPHGAFTDEKCAKATGDGYLDGLVARTRFTPALQAGRAVDGVARLRIASLAL